MESLSILLGIFAVMLIGVMSPGPSFIYVARTAVAVSRSNGLGAAVGMGIGSALFAIMVLMGLQALLLKVPVLYTMLKLLGGAYLIWMAISMLRGAKQPLTIDEQAVTESFSFMQSVKTALFIQMSNPKTAIYFASVLAALLPADFSTTLAVLLVVGMLILEMGWYALVALLLSSSAPRRAYLNAKTAIDYTAGALIGALGCKLLLDIRTG